MFYLFLPVFVPLMVYWLFPRCVELLGGKRPARDRVLLTACLLYFISWYLPSPLIHGQDTSFTTHFVGGGLFSGFLWLYAMRKLDWKISPLMELVSLYAFVSAFGVANELFELAIVEFKLVHNLNGADTWWDLLANTIGALAFWIVYRIVVRMRCSNAG